MDELPTTSEYRLDCEATVKLLLLILERRVVSGFSFIDTAALEDSNVDISIAVLSHVESEDSIKLPGSMLYGSSKSAES
jgi:hypothetical protein